MTTGLNGHGGNGADHGTRPPAQPPTAPLSAETAIEIRRGVGRLITGANELGVIALVSPVFLLGAFLAAEGFATATRHTARGRAQQPLDFALFGGYAVVLVALALRARLGAGRAKKILPDALSDDHAVRVAARARMLRLAGPAAVRRIADWVATRGCTLVIAFAVIAVAAWFFLPIPDPVWLVVFVGTAVAMDIRWRALVADVADQMPV